MPTLFLSLHALLTAAAARLQPPARRRDERGQTAAEYALVLLGAASVAMLVTVWATHSDSVGHLFDAVMDRVLQKARG